MHRPLITRISASVAVLAAAHAALQLHAPPRISDAFIDAGRALGGQVLNVSGCIVWIDGRPFQGGDRATALLNFVAVHGPVAVVNLAALAAGLTAYAVCAGPLGRTRAFGYRGPTRCGRCGYALAGLIRRAGDDHLRCPECGATL